MKIQLHRHPWAHHARPYGGRGGAHVKRLHLLAALAATAVTVLAVLASSGSAQSGERTIVLTERSAEGFYFVDQPPRRKPPSVSHGDQLISANRLVDAAKRRAGRVEVVCTAVYAAARSFYRGASFLCTGVAHLADGDLFLEARFKPRRPERASTVRGALTGGTGAYAGARGTFTTTGEPSTYTFHILP